MLIKSLNGGIMNSQYVSLGGLVVILLLACILQMSGCDGTGQETQLGKKTGEPAMKLSLTSTTFADGEPIPRRYSGEGEDISVPLSISGVPAGVKELAMIVDDPDAPRPQPWVHWVIYKIPAGTNSLAEGIAKVGELAEPAGARQGKNTSDNIGYQGPMPPGGHGVHHYHFKLYALDIQLDLKAGADKQELLSAMAGHIVAETELIGTYER